MNTSDLRTDITSRLIEALKSGARPWHQPWTPDPNCGSPRNVASRKGYRGINPLLLELSSLKFGFESRWWGTYNQWKELKGQVRKGEKGTRVVFWRAVDKEIDPETGRPDRFFVMRSYVLFNLDQVDGDCLAQLRPSTENLDEQSVTVDWEMAEHVLSACNATEQFGGEKAFYRPSHDSIQIPNRSRFPQLADFYATRFHEYGHWACN